MNFPVRADSIARLVAAITCLSLSAATAGAAEAATARTPAEWLETLRRETAQRKATEDPQLRRLLLSAARALHPHGQGPGILVKVAGARRTRFGAFLTWMEREGDALFRTWRSGEKLPAEAGKYLPILNGVALFRYRALRRKLRQQATLTAQEQDLAQYGRRIDARGQELLRKGYLGGNFSRAEIEELCLYAVWLDIRNTGGGVLPFHLGLTERWKTKQPPHGGLAPDFTLLRMDAALRSPRYSDLNPAEATDLLRPASVLLQELLLAMQGYEPAAGAGPARVKAKPIVVPEGREADYVRLSSFRGKKAVLLVLANPTDAWCWHWRLAPMLEPLHQAYRDRIAFVFVNTTIHDAHMPVKDFFGADPARHDAVHDLSVEQRARTCKLFYMNWPHATIPYLLDDVSQRTRNAYRDQGGGAYMVLIDLDGRVAYADYHQDIPPHWGPKAVSFPDEYLTIRMNHLESRLSRFVANGCRWARRETTPYPVWRKGPELKGTLAALDAAQSTVTVASAAPKGETRRQAFAVPPTARVTLDHRVATLKDLKTGDGVVVRWRRGQPNDGTEAPPAATLVRAQRDGKARHDNEPTIWLSGRIAAVDAERRVLTVVRHRPVVAEMKGWGFWQAAGDRATPYDADARARLGVVGRWVRAGDDAAARTCRLAIDDAVDVFLHGRRTALSALRPGDRVGVLYRAWQEGRPLIHPEQVRAARRP